MRRSSALHWLGSAGCRYDFTTGSVLNGPAVRPLVTYQVSETDGMINILG